MNTESKRFLVITDYDSFPILLQRTFPFPFILVITLIMVMLTPSVTMMVTMMVTLISDDDGDGVPPGV